MPLENGIFSLPTYIWCGIVDKECIYCKNWVFAKNSFLVWYISRETVVLTITLTKTITTSNGSLWISLHLSKAYRVSVFLQGHINILLPPPVVSITIYIPPNNGVLTKISNLKTFEINENEHSCRINIYFKDTCTDAATAFLYLPAK